MSRKCLSCLIISLYAKEAALLSVLVGPYGWHLPMCMLLQPASSLRMR